MDLRDTRRRQPQDERDVGHSQPLDVGERQDEAMSLRKLKNARTEPIELRRRGVSAALDGPVRVEGHLGSARGQRYLRGRDRPALASDRLVDS